MTTAVGAPPSTSIGASSGFAQVSTTAEIRRRYRGRALGISGFTSPNPVLTGPRPTLCKLRLDGAGCGCGRAPVRAVFRRTMKTLISRYAGPNAHARIGAPTRFLGIGLRGTRIKRSKEMRRKSDGGGLRRNRRSHKQWWPPTALYETSSSSRTSATATPELLLWRATARLRESFLGPNAAASRTPLSTTP